MKKAVFPGSFDPLTLGHCDIINKSLNLFDEIVLAIGVNSTKESMFSIDQRKKFITDEFINEEKIKILTYEGLTVDFCKNINADFIVRGLRNPADFEFEKTIAQTNKKLTGIETVFFLTSPETAYISSSIVREIITNKGEYTKLVPKSVRWC
ncbi:MAG: pantetheine-phosphate adenylyltransferase [Flavobacteriaceae bacterium]|jgi:pantetheine-phosphate adenylyltransferase|nr:pantetheine-phosphate adenylyltransferase [Flavobacteriaceae bacterium]